jgi:hypothetical protein
MGGCGCSLKQQEQQSRHWQQQGWCSSCLGMHCVLDIRCSALLLRIVWLADAPEHLQVTGGHQCTAQCSTIYSRY